MYAPAVVQEIKDRLSIVGVIGECVPLKKAGRNFKGLCPFHKEKSPSFMVSEEKQIYHCFGCGEGGDIFRFLMKLEGNSFPEALKTLAARAGVTLPAPTGGAQASREEAAVDRHRRMLLRVNHLAMEYFHQRLMDEAAGERARNYLISRGFKNSAFWAQHFLGSAEDAWEGLVDFLTERKVPMALAAELGLVRPRKGGDGYYDFFRGRLIFPIRTPKGEVCGFGGRIIPGTEGEPDGRPAETAKYLNSADSLLYQKGRTLYGLHTAATAIRANDRVVIVEGNLDVLTCQQAGIQETVAPLGTALTAAHLRGLRRYTRNLWVVFDGDAAGRQAARRSLPAFLEEGLVPRVVVLPAGEDPDSLVQREGGQGLLTLMPNAPTLFEWIIDETVAGCGHDTPGKAKAVEQLRPLFAMCTDPVEEASYLRRLAGRLALDEAVVRKAFAKAKGRASRRGLPLPVLTPPAAQSERAFLEFLLQVPTAMGSVAHRLQPTEFRDSLYQAIAVLCWRIYEERGELRVADVVAAVATDALRTEITRLALIEGKFDEPELWERVIEDLVAALRRPQRADRVRDLHAAIAAAEQSGHPDEVRRLMAELKREKTERPKTESVLWNESR